MGKLVWPNYGPPRYDIINKGYLEARLEAQSSHKHLVYSSDWYSFQETVLNNNPYVDRALFKLAQKAVFALKREIPIGENSKDGHLRNKVKAYKVRNGGLAQDRTVYEIHAEDIPKRIERSGTQHCTDRRIPLLRIIRIESSLRQEIGSDG